MKYRFILPFVFILASCATEPGKISSLAYCNQLQDLNEASFQRLLDPRLDMVGCQVHVGQFTGKEIERIRILAKSGKKIILQLWWGPKGRYNWSYHSLPAIAYESEVQKDFFEGVSTTINAIGPENIYAAHMFEECEYFGLNIDVPGDWFKNKTGIVDGKEDGNSYSNSRQPQSTWSVKNPNVYRYGWMLARDTGLKIEENEKWDSSRRFAFKRWCERSAARAEIAFFDFLDSKYPTIKKYSWYLPGYPNYTKADFGLLRERADGFMIDPYANEHFNYQYYRTIRTLCPNAEINAIIYGGFTSENVRKRRLTAAYLGGVTAMGFFEGQGRQVFGTDSKEDIAYAKYYNGVGENMDYWTDAIWNVNMSLLSSIKKVPPFRGKAPVLLVSGRWDCDWRASCHSYLGLKFFDPVPQDTVWMLDIFSYDLVIANGCAFSNHEEFYRQYKMPGRGIDSKIIEEYIRNGGLLMIHNCNALPEFLKDYVEMKPPAGRPVEINAGSLMPGKTSDDNSAVKIIAGKIIPRQDVKMTNMGCLVKYGKGYVFIIPHLNAISGRKNKEHLNFERFLADTVRELLLLAGKEEAASSAVDDIQTGYNYRMAADNGIAACFQFFPRAIDSTRFTVFGTDIFSGEKNPEFSPDNSGIILEQKN